MRSLTLVCGLVVLVAALLPAAAEESPIAAGDGLSLQVAGESDLSGNYRVADDGSVTIPLVGRLQAAGKTCTQLTQDLTTAFSKYLKKPVVTVALAERRRRLVTVGGQVKAPGSYEIGPTSTLLQAIGLAGGPQQDADLAHVRLMRNGEATVYDLSRYQRENDVTQNPRLEPGDDVLVEASRHFFVTGAVERPGAYLPMPGMTMAEAIARAGGYTAKADLTQAVLIKASGEKVTLDLSGLRTGDTNAGGQINPGDSLYLPEVKNINVLLLGGFRQTGRLSVPEQTSVIELLGIAGAQPGAKTSELRIVRQQGEKPVSIKPDVGGYLTRPNAAKLQAMVLQEGDTVYLPPPPTSRPSKWGNLSWLPQLLLPFFW